MGAIVAGVAAIATAPVSAPVAAVAIVGSAVVGGAIGLYLNRNQQTNIDTTPIPGLNPNNIPDRNTPKPRFDPNDINYGKTPDFLPDPLAGGGFRLGVHFDPNDININHGVSLTVPHTLTFPRGENCLFPPFFEANGNTPSGSRGEAFNLAKDRAGIPRSTSPTRQWEVGDNATRAGQENYRYSRDLGTHGRYYEYETPNGTRVIAEHTNDPGKPPHFHAGEPKGPKDEIRRNVDFKEERYLQIGGSHKFTY